MIKSYKTLSNRYLKQNRKSTLLTMIGIVLSVALLSSMGHFMLTLKNTMIDQSIEQTGNFHARVENLSKDSYEKLKSNIKLELVSPLVQENPVPLVKDKEVILTRGNNELFTLMNVTLLEGGLPRNNEEVVLEQWVLKYFDDNISIGDQIYITNDENIVKLYTLVGIAKDKLESKNIGVANAYTFEDIMINDNVSTLIKIKDNVNKRELLDSIGEIFGKENVRENTSLLQVTGETGNRGFNSGLFGVILTIVGIIVVSSIMFIYNTFHISIAERTKQIGQLRVMGATRKQIKQLVIRESFIMTIISIPIGLIMGIVLVYIVAFIFRILSKDYELEVEISWLFLIISTLIGILSVYISAILPARSASKISPLAALDSSHLIRKEKNNRTKIKDRKLIKFIKIDKIMAIRNIKRNKKRFYISVISIALSVMLFISATSFIKFISYLGFNSDIENTMQFEIILRSEGSGNSNIAKDFIEKVKDISGVDEVYLNYNTIQSKVILNNGTIIDNENKYFSPEKVIYENVENEISSIILNGFDENKLELIKPYISSGSIENLKENEIILVRKNSWKRPSNIYIDLKVGDEIKIDQNYYESSEIIKENYKSNEVKIVKIRAIIDNLPYTLDFSSLPNIIMSTQTLEELISSNPAQNSFGVKSIMIKTMDEDIDSVDSNLINLIDEYPQYEVINKADMLKLEAIEQLRITILIMGFVGVIILISSINIINTVASNIVSRKRELASLKAIGMTSKELQSMICFEGAIFGIYGGILGSILGNIMAYIIYMIIAMITDIEYNTPYISTIFAMSGVIAIGYISALIPMKKFTKTNMIEDIK